MEVRQVVRAGFQITKSPQIRARAMFQPATATGKLNAEITPTIPSGFHYSSIQCCGLSLGMTLPDIVLDIPTAISHISINSCTSPYPSDNIFPISKEITAANDSLFFLSSSPIYLTISPLYGAGSDIHRTCSDFIPWIHWE